MSNAIQLRDASDVTTFKKQKALYRNFTNLQEKDQVPLGGISHTDLMGYARSRATYISADSLVATVTAQADCPSCTNNVTYSTTATVAPVCVSGCVTGGSYAPNYYQTFQAAAVKKVKYT